MNMATSPGGKRISNEASRLNNYNQDALKTLLEYDGEDVLNLKTLRERLI